MGRRPNPNASSESTMKRRKNTALLAVPNALGLSAPPDWLLPAAKELWINTGRDLIENGILTSIDMGVFADYCQVSANLLEVEMLMREKREGGGSPYAPESGEQPLYIAQLRYVKQKTALAGELGMTPAGRSKVKAKTKETPTALFDSFHKAAYGGDDGE